VVVVVIVVVVVVVGLKNGKNSASVQSPFSK